MGKEVIVNGIILRIFNRNPSCFIQKEFFAFMSNLLEKLQELTRTLELTKTKCDTSDSQVTIGEGDESESIEIERFKRMRTFISH